MTCPDFNISLFLEDRKLGLLANFNICGIADLAKPWVLAGMGLNLGFFLLVDTPSGSSVFTNQFLKRPRQSVHTPGGKFEELT